MDDNKVDLSLINLSEESALKDRKKDETYDTLLEEAKLIKTACERIDVLNLRLGIYTNTVLAKIKSCREILTINTEKIPLKQVEIAEKHLDKINGIIDAKLKYGERLSKYLDRKDSDLVDQIKSNLLDADLVVYSKIQQKLLNYRDALVKESDKLISLFEKK